MNPPDIEPPTDMKKSFGSYACQLSQMRDEIRTALQAFHAAHGDIDDDNVGADRAYCDIHVRDGVSHEAFPTAIRKADDGGIVVDYYDIVDDNCVTLGVGDLQLDALMAALHLTELWHEACVE